MKSKLLTVSEVAERLKVCKETVRRYIREGNLKVLSLPGGSYRIPERELNTLLRPGPVRDRGCR